MKQPSWSRILTYPALHAALVLGVGGLGATAHAESPHTIRVRGHLSDLGGEPVTASLPMTFRVYDTMNGGGALWTEPHDGAGVDVVAGVFEVSLGAVVDFPEGLFAGGVIPDPVTARAARLMAVKRRFARG